MNKAVKAGEIFQLRELVPYQQGKIVNMDVLREVEIGRASCRERV